MILLRQKLTVRNDDDPFSSSDHQYPAMLSAETFDEVLAATKGSASEDAKRAIIMLAVYIIDHGAFGSDILSRLDILEISISEVESIPGAKKSVVITELVVEEGLCAQFECPDRR